MSAESNHGRIIVLGMHRSGTSCIGGVLAAMGAYFGPPGMDIVGSAENPHGFFERRDLRGVCDFLLEAAGAEWWSLEQFAPDRVPAAARARADKMLAAILAELDAHRPWFVKEPRLSLLLPIMQKRLGSFVTVYVWRDPLEVAESVKTRNGIALDFGIALWERYVRAAFTATTPHVIVSYNALVADPTSATRRLFEALTALGVVDLHLPDPAQLARTVDPALRRSRPRFADAELHLTPVQLRLLAALKAGDPTSPVFAEPMSSETAESLTAWARARRTEMRSTAHKSFAEVVDRIVTTPMRTRLSQTTAALRYLPWSPAKWLKWLRRGQFRRRIRARIDAFAIASIGAFDPVWYRQRHPDVALAGVDPLLHYVLHGAAEGRDPTPYFASAAYQRANSRAADAGTCPLLHCLRKGITEGRSPI